MVTLQEPGWLSDPFKKKLITLLNRNLVINRSYSNSSLTNTSSFMVKAYDKGLHRNMK